ncbi:MAG: NF038122 family metalloprotease [Paucibacter sp.]|nr:NF038122 family metalloprotease [Roseateles sp.]
MPTLSRLAAATLAAALAATLAAPAGAVNIILNDVNNSFANAPNGPEALYAFRKAANYWNKTLSNDATVRIDIGFSDLGSNVLGSTSINASDVKVSSVYNALAATGNSALDTLAVAHLSPLNAGGGLSMRVNGYLDPAAQTGIDTAAATRLATGNSRMNNYLSANTSVLKALNLSTGQPAGAADATINFSSTFAFDYNPSNGISNGAYDFTAVAVHELGHALGFISGADVFDVYGHPNGPLAGQMDNDHIDNYSVGSTLDLFRYGNGFNADGSRQLQWAANRPAFLSIDGEHVFSIDNSDQQAAFFSTGEFNGDGNQASHWIDNLAATLPNGCLQSVRQVGIMDPTIAPCDVGEVTQNDLAAFDAMGWNLHENILADPNYHESTAAIYQLDGLAPVVPEPDMAGMLLAGLGITGMVARRRQNRRFNSA